MNYLISVLWRFEKVKFIVKFFRGEKAEDVGSYPIILSNHPSINQNLISGFHQNLYNSFSRNIRSVDYASCSSESLNMYWKKRKIINYWKIKYIKRKGNTYWQVYKNSDEESFRTFFLWKSSNIFFRIKLNANSNYWTFRKTINIFFKFIIRFKQSK